MGRHDHDYTGIGKDFGPRTTGFLFKNKDATFLCKITLNRENNLEIFNELSQCPYRKKNKSKRPFPYHCTKKGIKYIFNFFISIGR